MATQTVRYRVWQPLYGEDDDLPWSIARWAMCCECGRIVEAPCGVVPEWCSECGISEIVMDLPEELACRDRVGMDEPRQVPQGGKHERQNDSGGKL